MSARPVRTILSALPLLLVLGACSRTPPAADLMADARRYRDQGDTRAAIIQLKNAVQQQPGNAAARLMLGQLYLDSGDMLSAEKELRRARDGGAGAATVLAALGRALLAQGQFERVLGETETAGDAAALALRGQALLGLGRSGDARSAFEEALRRQPGLVEATLGMARVALAGGDAAQARRLTDQAIGASPDSVDALRLRGDLQRAAGQRDAARASYERIVSNKPNNVQAHVDLANLDIEAGRFKEARERIARARKAQPNSLLIFYSQALLDFREGHAKSAREQLQQVLRTVPDHLPSVLLAGAVELALGADGQAERYLTQFLQANPGNAYATKLLATVALRGGQLADALKLIHPLLKATPDDVEALALAGEAEMRARHFDRAAEHFQKASVLRPDAAGLRLAHGVSRLGMGENVRAIAELEHASQGTLQAGRAGILLVLTHLREKQFDKALAAVDGMIQAGDNAMLQNLRAGVLLGRSDVEGARAGFEKALALDPLYQPALDNLAQLDVVSRKPEDARKRYEEALARDKTNVGLMTALARLATQQGKPAQAMRWLEQAHRERPDAAAPAQLLAAFYLRAGETAKALTLAQKLHATAPEAPDMLALLAETQAEAGQPQAALESFEKLAVLQPSAAAQLRIATLHLADSRVEHALAAARKAVKLEPDNGEAAILLSSLLIEKNALAEATTHARGWQARHAGLPLGFKLEGDVLMVQHKPADALQRYEQAFKLAPSGPVLMALHRALQVAGRQPEAAARMAAWLERQPADQPTRMYYASALVAAGDFAGAGSHYLKVVERSPDNVVALNDLAWTLLQQKDPRALAHAERAHRLAPRNPAVADTLAAILLERGDTAKALPLLRQAVAGAPNAAEIRFHLAQALLKAGDRPGARAECEHLLQRSDFKRHDEVRRMLAQL
ncbi:XrtA/PEP-CTERM system TPR-repeat protein PrsT [Pseudoduganella chitinolytica]|uniref:PEP-CTERM system TPR-repeat protein PrsT n=1 Tax=Pseudoduganella chitinolytica TaxID=34070 RepID=A0ABY8BF73_9BURK|nr:XrtA/PEP-CTERM system TPR-repeat protein PrsT [Pseudoduganella chitinolytica]WEF34550.1 PEP-CTERM system TPR-repeat protein PrsT [Pseudoduganella chitinolytica]